MRGYAQLRSSRAIVGDRGYVTDHDRFVGAGPTIGFRRIRVALTGDLHDRLSMYFQPDFASAPPGGDGVVGFTQLRDMYVDLALDGAKSSRLRIGQSKLPYGFENMQSSSNRLPLDRADALNTASDDERDLGVFYYWAPPEVRQTFKQLVDDGLKGSGDFGVVGLGVYGGQGANRLDKNGEPHVVARATWPQALPFGQIGELGAQAYHGRYVPTHSTGVTLDEAAGLIDERAAITAVLYPRPFGLQAEWNAGRGPRLDPARQAIGVAPIDGGYLQGSYRWEAPVGVVTPFIRWQRFHGGKKTEKDAPDMALDETDYGGEWEFDDALELTLQYTHSARTDVTKAPYGAQRADLVRAQLQWSF